MKKRDRYLGQCDSIRTPQRRSKRNAKQNGDTTISGSALEPEGCSRDVIGKTSVEELGGGGSFQHSSSNQIEEMDESDWEDGTIPILQSANNNRDDTFRGLTIEFSGSPDSAKKKPVRRASAEDKELAELVHKVHLLCLIARGRLIDSACDDPLIQASLLSLLPINLLKISEVSKLTANALAPLVRWFHSNFRMRSPKVEERSFRSALAFALETHEGTPEEIAALSVSLFRALKLTTRFVSILDVVSLKPGIDKSEPLSQDASRSGRGIFKSSTPMVSKLSRVSVSPVPSSSCYGTENNCQTSRGVAHGCKDSSSRRNDTQSEGFPTADELSQRMLDSLACNSQNNPCEALHTKKSENLKRKGDLEYELQLEMALSATAAGVCENNTGSDVSVLHTDSSELSSPLKKIKFVKSEDSPTSSHGISTAIGSRKVGAPLYWAEVYCTGENLTGKWVHCDAVNAIIDGEQKVEAEAAACKTSLRYVVAFAGHGAKDVTRRYCMKWYRIAAQRINSVWWDAVLAPLKELESGATGGTVNLEKQQVNPSNDNDEVELSNDYGKKIDSEFSMLSSSFAARSSLEDMELETRALTEPLPTNQQAYKSHHLYAIERWLTKYQILYPKGPVLGFCSGYPVYPRACVQTLKTKERWLREGLQVKANELPAKVLERSVKGSKLHTSEDNDCVEHEREPKFSVYGRWQLEPLCLPRAANGIVPKNERGQVDVWSEKCLPPGTVHLRLPRVFSIAKRLEVDSAPAMVGFEFRNGRSMPVFEGIVVCAEYKDAILAVYAEEEERRQAEEKKMNERQAISRWYQLLSSIVTRQRLNNCYGDGFLSQTTSEIPIADTKFQEHVSGGRGNGQSLESQQEYVRETKIDALSTVLEENHEHVFLPEDQSYDEESFVRTKRCRCGFAIQVEEL